MALALPMIVGHVSQMLMGLTDTAFIGHLGAVPLAASAVTQGVFGMFYVVCVGSLVGPGVFAAREHGAGNAAGSASWLRHGLVLALAIGLAGFCVLAVVSTQFARLGQPSEVIAQARGFYLLVAASLIPALLFQVQRQFAEAVGKAWGPTFIGLGSVGLNALLNWLFIFGHGGFPRLGLVGSAWSTLLARTLALAVLAAWLSFSRALAPWRSTARRTWQRARFFELVRFGAPVAAMLVFETGAFGAATLMMGWLGTVPLAAHQIALGCASLSFMAPLGLSYAVSMRISRACGAGDRESVRAIGLGALFAGLALMLSFAGLFAWRGRFIAGLFTSVDSVAALAAQLLAVAAVFQVFDGSQVISQGALRGLGDVRVPAFLTFGAYWLLSLPLGYLMAFHYRLGARGLWLGLGAGLLIAALSLALRFLHRS